MAAGERARRRAEREREVAAAAVAQRAEAARRTRRAARRTTWTRWFPSFGPATGPLAARHRQQTGLAVAFVVTANALTLLGTSTWAPRVAVLLLTVSLTPIALSLIRD